MTWKFVQAQLVAVAMCVLPEAALITPAADAESGILLRRVQPSLPSAQCSASNKYDLQLIKAGIQSFPTPHAADLAHLTEQVSANNNYRSREDPATASTMKFLQKNNKHVIYIIKENKTFDQILRDGPVGERNPALTEFGNAVTPNLHNIARNFVTLDHFYDSSEVSYDGWAWSTSARAPDIEIRQTPVNYASRGLSYESEEQIAISM